MRRRSGCAENYPREKLIENALHTGAYLMQRLQELHSPLIKEIRGRGLMVGVELTVPVKEVREPCCLRNGFLPAIPGCIH